jgi:D-threonate/D-erythronate kinase
MTIQSTQLGLIADDLTGALDTSLAFFPYAPDLTVLVKPSQTLSDLAPLHVDRKTEPKEDLGKLANQSRVWSLNTDTRHEDYDTLKERLSWAAQFLMKQQAVEHVYKKIDSTCRGSVALECLALCDSLSYDAAILCPGYPAQGRQVVGNYLLLRGLPVELSEIARDPLAPVRLSHLNTILKQQLGPDREPLLGSISLSTVLKGAGPILNRISDLVDQGVKLITVDTATTTDLQQIALAMEKARKRYKLLPCGSGGLAQALAPLWMQAPEEWEDDTPPEESTPEPIDLPKAPILLVAGSNMPMTRKQLQKVLEHPRWKGQTALITLKPGQLLGLESLESLQHVLMDHLQHQTLTVVTTAWDESTYEDTLALAREGEDKTLMEVAIQVQRALTTLLKPAFGLESLQWILCGGHTAQSVCQAMGTRSLKILRQIETTIALSQDERGRYLVTKSGNFGDPLSLTHVVQYLLDSQLEEKGP